MQWIILICGLTMLWLLKRRKQVSPPAKETSVSGIHSLNDRLSQLAPRTGGYGSRRVRISRRLNRELEDSLRYLARFSLETLSPAAHPLCENARLIQERAKAAMHHQHKLPALPCSQEGVPRLWTFAAEIAAANEVLSADAVRQAISVWQTHLPMTIDELDALPVLLEAALTEQLCDLARQCRLITQAQRAAMQVHLWQKHGKERAAQKLLRRYALDPAFQKELLRLEDEGNTETASEEAAQQEHRRQALLARRTENAVQSLQAVSRMPWERMREEASILHSLLSEDPVYSAMDAKSRVFYCRRAAMIAKRCRRTERMVCQEALALCRSAEACSLSAHTGYYLLDEGLPELLSRLHAYTPIRRLKAWAQRRAFPLRRLVWWIVFFGLLAAGFFGGIAVLMLVPFAMVFLMAILHPAHELPAQFVPRLALSRIPDDRKVLVVCPAVLTDKQQALETARRLSIMHRANPDPNLHFLLLGDFQDSLTATLTTDDQVIATAASAVEALCADTGHPFFYLQRERIFLPGDRCYACREHTHGALETILSLTEGRPIADGFAYAGIPLSSLQGQYRYVIFADGCTHLPPESVLHMVGAMMHPLQKRCMLRLPSRPLPHQQKTFFARWFAKWACHEPAAAIIDPPSWLDEVQGWIPQGCILNAVPLEDALTGSKCDADIPLPAICAQTFHEYLGQIYKTHRSRWQLLPCLLPFIGYPCRKKLDPFSRSRILQAMIRSLLEPLQLLVLLYAAFTGRSFLLAAALLAPRLHLLFPLSPASAVRYLLKLCILPCEAFVQADAIARTLVRLIARRRLMDHGPMAQKPLHTGTPPMLFFSISMSCAGLFAAFPILLDGSWACLAPAVLWAAFPFVLAFLEQPQARQHRTSGSMRQEFMRLAQQTLVFFDSAVAENAHGLPSESIQMEPNQSIAHHTAPDAIGLYLCAMIAANRMELLDADEAAGRIQAVVQSLEQMPKWHGLFYARYDLQTLAPVENDGISSESCGILAVSLLTCAQGLRVLLPQLSAGFHSLPERLDQLCHSMQLGRLYDADAGLFRISLHPFASEPSPEYHQLLASESRLLSFVSIMLGAVPVSHWDRLEKILAPSGALLSPHGAMSEYMVPLLFQPAIPGTMLNRTSRRVFRLQWLHRLGGAFGVSTGGYHTFDEGLNGQSAFFGLPGLSMRADVESNVLSSYASMLCLSLNPKAVLRNLHSLQRLGMEGPMGLWEAADFSPARTEDTRMAIVRSYTAAHQGMVLCALCNALCDGYISQLFSHLPVSSAYSHLVQESPDNAVPPVRRPVAIRTVPEPEALFSREALLLSMPPDAHLLAGGDTSVLVDAQGGGFLTYKGQRITLFRPDHVPSGSMRIYIRDSESGRYWTAADPYLQTKVQFDSSQAVFCAERNHISSELRVWISPLDGSCIQLLTLENQSETERLMEVCSYCEPDPAVFSDGVSVPLARRTGRCAVMEGGGLRLQQTICTDTDFSMFRIQTDRTAFLGRGRSMVSPRAMETPISAVADSLGLMPHPCISLRGQFSMPPNSKHVFGFVTSISDEQAEQNDPKSGMTMDDLLRTFRYARMRSREIVRYLRLNDAMQRAISLIPGVLANARSPMLLYTCCGSINEPRLKLLLKSHAFLRTNGLAFDLAILIEDCTHRTELAAEAQALISASHSRELRGLKAGVHLYEGLSGEQEAELRSKAVLLLTASGGTLEKQLNSHITLLNERPVYRTRPNEQWKTQLTDAAKPLLFPNGFGGFLPDTGDYQITLPPGRMTPAPWFNRLHGRRFDTLAAESGLLHTGDGAAIDSADAVSPANDEQFFLRDDQNRLLWSLTRLPLGHGTSVRVTHAPGESVYESSGYGISARLTAFSDRDEPAGLRIIHLQNESRTERTLTVFHSCRIAENEQRRFHLCAVDPTHADTVHMPHAVFQGLWRQAPYALSALEQPPDTGGDTCVLSLSIKLKPGESRTLTTAVLEGDNQQAIRQALDVLRDSGGTQRLMQVRSLWQERLGSMQFDLPDQALNLLLGRWLPCQALCTDDDSPAVLMVQSALMPLSEKVSLQRLTKALEHAGVTGQMALIITFADWYERALPSAQVHDAEALLQHCTNLLKSMQYGAHGLPLTENGLESVPAGMLLCEAIRRLAPHCPKPAQDMLSEVRNTVLAAIERSAWDGGWYLYGWNVDGTRLGGSESAGCRMTLLPQCLAAICGASHERCETAMGHVWQSLYEPDVGLIRAADHPLPEAGLTADQDTSAACAAMSALHLLGQEDRAWELLGALMPPHHTAGRQLALRFHTEPYAMPGKIYADGNLRGRAALPWDANAAASFMVVVIRHLLGLQISGRQLRFQPSVPSSWDSLRITLHDGSTTWHLLAQRDCAQPSADGEPLPDGVLILADDGRIHEAVFPL